MIGSLLILLLILPVTQVTAQDVGIRGPACRTCPDMAPKIPKGFGAVKAGSKAPDKQTKEGAPLKKTISPSEPALKRKETIDLSKDTPKKPRTEDAPTSMVLSHLGPLASVYVGENEIKEWEMMSLEEAIRASIKASAQLMYHSMNSIEKLTSERARLTRLEGENSSLLRKLKENDLQWQKELKAKTADLNFANKEIKDQEEMLNVLNDKFNKQESELDALKARLSYLEDQQAKGWPDEKEKIEDENFEKGFNFYLTGFLANDPEYKFEKFGEESRIEIQQFKIDNAALIKARRVELGLEEGEDAPTDDPTGKEVVVAASHLEVNPPAKEAPSDGASATPIQPIPPTDQPLPDDIQGAP